MPEFHELQKQFQKVQARAAWVNENLGHPDHDVNYARMLESSRRFGRMGDQFAEAHRLDVSLLVSLLARAAPAPEGST